MYLLKSKHIFRKLSILILIPYFILCITAGGFHAFDHKAYHGHADSNQTVNDLSNSEQSGDSAPIFCNNDHSEDNCIVCKWLKGTAKRVQFVQNDFSIFHDSSKVCINDYAIHYFLKARTNSPRSPPFFIS